MRDARRERTREYHGKNVVMLDHLVQRHAPHAWPVSAVRDAAREAGDVTQVAGGAPTLLPRGEYEATPGAAVRVVNARTGETLPARVYRLERRSDV